jgi:hypothetical protein
MGIETAPAHHLERGERALMSTARERVSYRGSSPPRGAGGALGAVRMLAFAAVVVGAALLARAGESG